MFSELVSAEDAAYILDIQDINVLADAVAADEIKPAEAGPDGERYLVGDLVQLKLAWAIMRLGVAQGKAVRYSDAVLGVRLSQHDRGAVDWVENETQDLFCLIADSQLARIYLRNKEDDKEVDVGAVRPILLPTTKCEINVFRVIRPAVHRALQILGNR